MTTPQSLTQGFLQNSAGLQTQAQSNMPATPNNGNPGTIYNVPPPQGGYLPPVMNAYDQWRINPLPSSGGGWLPGSGGTAPIGGIGFPNVPQTGLPPIPVRPPVTPPPTTPPTTPPTGGPTPPSSTQVGNTLLGGRRVGWGVDLGWGGTGVPTYYATSTGVPNAAGWGGLGSNSGFRWGMNGLLGNVIDGFLPGDAIQGGHINWANLGLGLVDQYTGLPITRGLGWLADTNWAQNSPNAVARWLRNWSGENDAAAMQEWYDQNGYTASAGTGWMAGAFPWLDQQRQAEAANAASSVGGGLYRGLSNPLAQAQREANAYREYGAAAFVGQINPATGRTYTAREIHNISQNLQNNPGIGLRAAGAFAPWGSTGIQGEAAREMFAGMKDIKPTRQFHNNAN